MCTCVLQYYQSAVSVIVGAAGGSDAAEQVRRMTCSISVTVQCTLQYYYHADAKTICHVIDKGPRYAEGNPRYVKKYQSGDIYC